jgi:16S rRNA (guanine966-N2)-methyltransferase
MLRIIGGTYKRTILEGPPDAATTRPITARAKESLFNLLRGWCDDAKVLDLFAGVGAIGLEALSRGASEVVLVECDRRIARILERNIRAVEGEGVAHLVIADALGPAALAQAPRDCDLVFVDPPYALWEDDEGRANIIDLMERAHANMKPKSFLILRTPCEWEKDVAVAGFDGPESHPYSLDMFVHLFCPSAC